MGISKLLSLCYHAERGNKNNPRSNALRWNEYSNITVFLLIVFICFSCTAFSAGGTLHMFMAENAVDFIKDKELKEFIQENFDIVRWNAWYPDFGYGCGYPDLSEMSHWTPFVDAYIDYIKNNSSIHKNSYKLLVSHLMGVLAHGISDETFDHLFVKKIQEVDGVGQDATDRGLDMVCMWDYKRQFVKSPSNNNMSIYNYVPLEDLALIYEKMGVKYTHNEIKKALKKGQKTLMLAMLATKMVYTIEHLSRREQMPWGSKHYYDAPGGVIHSAKIIASYWDNVWKRIKGNSDDFNIISTFPENNGQILSTNHSSVDSGIHIFFNEKYDKKTIAQTSFIVTDKDNKQVDGYFDWCYQGRMLSFIPSNNWAAGAKYTVRLLNTIQDDKGKHIPSDYVFSFTTLIVP